MAKDVLLIFPKTGLDLENVNVEMPMGLMAIAAPLLERGYQVTILDQRLEEDFFQKVEQYLNKNPICVGITTMTGLQILYALQIANFIRRRCKIPIVWGGNHPTLMPDQTLSNKNVDVVVRGEGEESFTELVGALHFSKSFKKIKGISWREGLSINHNPEREFCDLNRLPPVPYNLVDVERYIISQIPGRKRSLDVYTSRGCPYKCIFCYNRVFNRGTYRKKSLDIVIKEIEWLVRRYNLDSVYINDDNFFIDTERCHSFCESIIKRGTVPEWGCQGVRIDSLEGVDFDLLEQSGCRHLYVGIESGSERILKYIKKQITIEQIKKVVNRFRDSTIIAHYNFMVGFPIEGRTELFETVELVNYIMKVDPKAYFSSFHLVSPYPGTEFYDIIQQYGFDPPKSLEGWANIRWEFENASWVPIEIREMCLNLTLLTYFIDRKGIDKTNRSTLLNILARILTVFARFHWRLGIFQFCPEFRLLHKLVSGRINCEIKLLKRACES